MGIQYHFILTVTGTLIGGQSATSTMCGTLMSNGSTRDTVLKELLAEVRERDAYLTEPSIMLFSLEPNRLGV